MKNKIYAIGITAFVLIWFTIAGFSWFGPKTAYSYSEQRDLAQMPKLTMETLLAKDEKNSDGTVKDAKSFMSLFTEYAEDQFPMRDPFRQAKAMYQYYVMQQKDDNGYYVTENHVAELVYPLNTTKLNSNLEQINDIYDRCLRFSGAKTYMVIVPDKGYYLAKENGYLTLDYNKMFQTVEQSMSPKVTHIDITDVLSKDSYYYTDTHWRQEKILPVAQKIAEAMGKTVEPAEAFSLEAVKKPFYGIYYKFAALPMNPEQMYLMQSELLKNCTVLNVEKGETMDMYDRTVVDNNDQMYDIFFSGNQAKVEITNHNNSISKKELVIFGDSFARSLVPLLVQDYYKITVIDLRLTKAGTLSAEQFSGGNKNSKDVLFLYSTLSLNKSITG